MADFTRTDFLLTATDQASVVFKSVGKSLGDLKADYKSFAVVAAGAFAAGGVASFVHDAINYRRQLEDLHRSTGDNVQTLDAMARTAKIAGQEFDSFQSGLLKFARNLNAADDEGKDAAKALQAIGLNIEELRAKKPADAMLDVAKALDKFGDGAGKVAVAVALMGREGAKQLPFLKDLAESHELVGKITAEEARQAEQLEKEYRRLIQAYQDQKQALVSGLVPVMADWIEQLRLAQKLTGGLFSAVVTLGTQPLVGNFSEQVAVLSERLERLKAARDQEPSPLGREYIDNLIKELEVRKQLAQLAERQQVLRGAGAGDLDARDLQAKGLGAKPDLEFSTAKEKRDKEAEAELKHYLFIMKQRQEARDQEVKDLEDIDKVNQGNAEKEIKRQEEVTALYAKAAAERIRYAEEQEAAASAAAEREYNAQYKYRKINAESASAFFGILGQMMESHNKRAFQIGKAAAIAQTIIDTYTGAQAAFKAFAGIPIVGPALGAAAAAAAIVVGLARVQAIRATTLGGGGGGGGGSVGTFPASPTTGVPTSPIGLQSNAPGPAQVTVIIQGNLVGNQAFIDNDLLPAITEAVGSRDFEIMPVQSQNAKRLIAEAQFSKV